MAAVPVSCTAEIQAKRAQKLGKKRAKEDNKHWPRNDMVSFCRRNSQLGSLFDLKSWLPPISHRDKFLQHWSPTSQLTHLSKFRGPQPEAQSSFPISVRSGSFWSRHLPAGSSSHATCIDVCITVVSSFHRKALLFGIIARSRGQELQNSSWWNGFCASFCKAQGGASSNGLGSYLLSQRIDGACHWEEAALVRVRQFIWCRRGLHHSEPKAG